MDIKMYSLPALEPENYSRVSEKVNELHARYRDKKPLDEIEIDWLDAANNWLIAL